MTTGNRSRTALVAARIALLAGASAAALLAAGSANAQGVVNPPFVSGDLYTFFGGAPAGADLTTINVPGVGLLTPDGIGVVENLKATLTPAGTTGALNANGTPITTTWATDPNYAVSTAFGAADYAANPSHYTAPFVTGDIILTSTGTVATSASQCGAGALNCTVALPTATDQFYSYQWVKATYAIDPSYTASNTLGAGTDPTTNPTHYSGTYGGGDVVLTSTGAVATAASQCTAAAKCTFAASTATDLVFPTGSSSAYITAQGVGPNSGYGTVTTNQGTAGTSTTSFAGGVVYANHAGTSPAQYTAIGPDGLYSFGGGATWTDGTASGTTTILNGGVGIGGAAVPTQGLAVLGGTTTDTLRVTGASTFGSTGQATIDASGNIATTGTISSTVTTGLVQDSTVINGSTVTISNSSTGASNVSNPYSTVITIPGTGMVAVGSPAGGTIGVGVTTPTGFAGIGTSVAGGPTGVLVTNAAGTPQFTANSSGYISAGGNRIQDVAAPIAGTDAANKAYVDKGVNKAYEGTAIALAISQPVFLPGQSFAMRAGWGGYEGQNAFGVSAAGVVARDVFGYGSTVALDGGVGVGGNYNGVAGKAGVTIGFGGGMAPLAPMK